MNALDILGSLLGGGQPANRGGGGGGGGAPQGRGGSGGGAGGGLGGGILEELLKSAMGGGASHSADRSSAGGSRSGSRGSGSAPMDIDREARSLEDLLGVATGKSSQAAPSPNEPSPYRPAPNPRYQPQSSSTGSVSNRSTPLPSAGSNSPSLTANDEAIFLIQALINAAKADGRVDANEQQEILSKVPNDPATINFLKQQFAQPLDVREFAWSVPLGMEVKVYTMSLAGMQLDNQAEADYLVELAHGLRLSPETCRQIHARYGAPDIF